MGVKLQYKVAVNEETARGGQRTGIREISGSCFFLFFLSQSLSPCEAFK